MALCLAESILDTGDDGPRRPAPPLPALEGRRATCRRTGGASTSATPPGPSSSGSDAPASRSTRTPDEDAAANGSLMRLAAVPDPLARRPGRGGAERSGESSRTTHAAARPVDACRLLGAMIAALISGATFDEVVAPDVLAVGRRSTRRSRAIAAGLVARTRSRRASGAPATASTPSRPPSGRSPAPTTSATPCCGRPTSATTPTRPPPSPASSPAPGGARRRSRPAWRDKVVAGDRIVALARRALRGRRRRPLTSRLAATTRSSTPGGWSPGGSSPASTRAHRPGAGRQKVDVLVDAGIRTFVDLTTPDDRLDPYGRLVADAAAARRARPAPRRVPDPRPGRRRRRRATTRSTTAIDDGPRARRRVTCTAGAASGARAPSSAACWPTKAWTTTQSSNASRCCVAARERNSAPHLRCLSNTI